MDLRTKIARLSQNRQQFEGALGRFLGGTGTATSHVADALGTLRPGGGLPHFLFIGPNGPAKDYLIRGIAQTLYDSEERIHEIDLSAYCDDRGGYRLLQGDWNCISVYAYEATGKLTRAFLRDPHAVFVFTHLDQAHPSVIDAFFPILDKGKGFSRDGDLDFSEALLVFSIHCNPPSPPDHEEPLSYRDLAQHVVKTYQLPPAFIGRLKIVIAATWPII